MGNVQTFKVTGVSRMNGEIKVRFANEVEGRAKILNKNGQTDIMLFDTGANRDKFDACMWIKDNLDKFGDVADEAESAADAFIVRNYLSEARELGLAEPAKPRGRPRKETSETPAVATSDDVGEESTDSDDSNTETADEAVNEVEAELA